jgi:2'-hydroxyisoflavone reductase
MRIVMLGGTRFVGRHIASEALARGHELTLVHRRVTDLFSEAEHLLLDRDGDLSALTDREFDATIDVSAYFPRQVRSVADALQGRGGRYLVISSTSVYAEPAGAGFDETSATVEPAEPATDVVDSETYGRLKVSIEHVARDLFGSRTTVVRPTYVIGPWDYTRRFTSWVERIAAGGEVLGPGDPADPIQVIDGRDMGSWVVGLVEGDVAGTFHAVSPPPPFSFGDLLGAIAAEVAPAGTSITWVDQRWLLDQGESDATIPLWGGGDPWIGANAASPAAAEATGLAPRLLARSIRDTLDFAREHPGTGPGPGLSRERETELLSRWHGRV